MVELEKNSKYSHSVLIFNHCIFHLYIPLLLPSYLMPNVIDSNTDLSRDLGI